jgi:hypothetical protein
MAKSASDPLADVFGPPKGKGMADDEEADDSALGFEASIVDAFPELAGKTERIAALKQAIKACYEEA